MGAWLSSLAGRVDRVQRSGIFFMQSILFSRRAAALAASLLCLSLSVRAEDAAVASSTAEKLSRVVTTGNPLRAADGAQPSAVLTGDALTVTRGATLGDTLGNLPGVASTYFGPNSNRPTIRGLDGDRVRMLSNAGASVDASSLSFDHAVPVDPLVVERIEVLRGAATLLYGGNAIGGVVNTIDNRIPRQAQRGLGGAAEVRLGGPQKERSGAVVLDGGTGEANAGFAWHADVAGRRADDQIAPRFMSVDGSTKRVRNSAADSHGGALGGSLLFSHGYAGVSVDDYRNEYGVTVEPDITIQMQRQRLASAGEWHDADAPIRRVRWQLSNSRYEHREIEGSGEVGTIFKSRGGELRFEAEHAPITTSMGAVKGVIGMQLERSNFSALGEEALVPASHTRNSALFVLEQFNTGPWSLSAGARTERVRVDSDGDADVGEPKFGPALSRRFKPTSLSLSGSYKLSSAWSLTANLTRSERAPMFYELLANGVHVASGAFERGDADLGMEQARALDLGLKWEDADGSLLHLNVFQSRFSRYIALDATGETLDELPVYAFSAVPARLTGFELEGRWALPAATLPGGKLALTAQLDSVRGSNRATGEPLPRLAPLRASFGVDAQQGPWSARVEWRLSARQNRVPSTDTATAGFGTVRALLSRQFRFGETDALWYLRLDNLGNKLAYSATSVATLRDLTPLPGRSISTGFQVRF